MHRDEHEATPAPAAAESAPEREITHEPVGEPTPFGVAIVDAESLFGVSGALHADPDNRRTNALRSNAAASIAIAHMLHRATFALERLAVVTGELVVHYSRTADTADAALAVRREATHNAHEFQLVQMEHAKVIQAALAGAPRSDNPTRN